MSRFHRLRTETYTYHGTPKTQVTVDRSGSIRVRKNDSIFNYSNAIHQSPLYWYNFGRFNRTSGRLEQLKINDSVRAGEIIVHIPTCNFGVLPDSDNYVRICKPTLAQQQLALGKYVTKQLHTPSFFERVLTKLCKVFNSVRLEMFAIEFVELLSTNTGLLSASAGRIVGMGMASSLMSGLTVLAQVMGPVGCLVTGLRAMLNNTERRSRAIGYLGFAYGFTAGIFGSAAPLISPRVKEMTQLQTTSFERGNNALGTDNKNSNKLWNQLAAKGQWEVHRAAKKLNIHVNTFRVIVRAMCNDDPKKVSALISNIVSAGLGPIQSIRLKSFVKSGCVYGS